MSRKHRHVEHTFSTKKIRPSDQADFLFAGDELPACKVRKCAVGFGHFVGVFFFLEGSTSFVVRVDDFEREALAVWHATASTG